MEMILKVFKKQPSEYKDYDIDYFPFLSPANDILDDIYFTVVCTTDEEDTSMTVDKHFITDHMLKMWVRGGVDGNEYKIEITAHTSGGRIDQSEVIFAVDDI
jgi:hypothetical protein